MSGTRSTTSSIILILLKLAIFSCNPLSVPAFAVLSPQRAAMTLRNKPSRITEDDPIECYLIFQDAEDEDGDEIHNRRFPLAMEKQKVVCTSAPDEYAWFNGIDEENMIPLENEILGALECVEGASPRGIPEWECR